MCKDLHYRPIEMHAGLRAGLSAGVAEAQPYPSGLTG